MARRTSADSSRGFDDIIGVVLLVLALLLLVSQWSFDAHDIGFIKQPPNKPVHNWIGSLGAYLAWISFLFFGIAGYLIPALFAVLGSMYLIALLPFLRERWRWSLGWLAALFISITGLLHLADKVFGQWHVKIGTQSVGGWLGFVSHEYLFWMLGRIGAPLAYLAILLVSLLFLTDFRLGDWLRSRFSKIGPATTATPEEAVLERKARELNKQAKKLEEEVARSGLGADLKPVPPPNVRDLSVPQASSGRGKKPVAEPVKEIAPPDEGEVIPAREVAAATTTDILGKKSETAEKPGSGDISPASTNGKAAGETPGLPADAPKTEPLITIADGSVPAAKPRSRKKPMTVASVPLIGNYQLPPMEFLQHPDLNVKPTESKEELMANARLMQQTLAQFDIEVSLGDITKGPTITRYELHPAPGVKLEKITALSNNIAAALKAERIHILAPVPGKSSVGVEVPNLIKTKVIMRDLLESEEWRATKARIPLALGKDVYGHPIIADLAEMPHCLIAGSTGSGKSVCINAIIASLLYKFSPDQLRFVMIDPKVVELQQYNTLPHLVVPVVTDPKKVILALRWVVNEMEKRYQIFAKVGVRNIKSFNDRPKNAPIKQSEPELPLMAKKEKVEPGAEGFAVEVDEEIVVPREEDIVIPEKLSYIVVIIDELADLMLVAPADVEMAIARITQMARAAGIHCIVATQRPSVDVITGVIKANIPARIAFQVAAKVDSRTILDAMGADKLLGKGDMLYLPPGSAKLIRAQGALITDQEIQSIVDFIAKQGKPSYEMEIHQQLSKPVTSFGDESGIDEDEDLIQQCIEVIRSEQKASVSLMQRRLRLGYTRAARIMDELENRGIVGPSKGAEPRDILIDLDGQGHDGAGQSAV
jgi:S-DNA-T family DNA segregation ATPase FtsK/SpoIIIE